MKRSSSIGKPKRGRKPARPDWDAEELARNAAAAADDKKAYDILILQITEFSSLADYLVICTGKSTRQVKAIAENIAEILSGQGVSPIGNEGIKEGRWALLDYADVIVHVFHEPLRLFYDLEGLWSEAPRTVYNTDPD